MPLHFSILAANPENEMKILDPFARLDAFHFTGSSRPKTFFMLSL